MLHHMNHSRVNFSTICRALITCTTIMLALFIFQACSDSKVTTKKKPVRDSAPAADSVDINAVPDAVPRSEPKSKYGNPSSYEVFGKRYYVMDSSKDFVQKGIASWYGKKFHGRRTSSGETYDMYAMTAAHKSLPLPTYVQVRNLDNNRRIIVKVNDRGPFHENRIIDLSYTAARKLDIVKKGTGLVEIRAINPRTWSREKEEIQYVGAPVQSSAGSSSKPGFYIQVGAFREEENARKLKASMVALGPDLVKIAPAMVNQRKIYRVRLGPLYDVDSADSLVGKLGDFGIYEHRIVVPH